MSLASSAPVSTTYRVLAAHRVSLGRSGEVAVDPWRSRADLLTPLESSVVAACHGAATLDEHAARALSMGVRGTSGAIRTVLSELADRGVLVSDEEICRMLATEASSESRGAEAPILASEAREPEAPAAFDEPLRVQLIGAPTRDRPRSLRRAIESYARDVVERGRAIEILIVDDGSTSTVETAAVLRDVASRTSARVRLVDRAAKHRFSKAIAAISGAPLHVVQRALAPDEPGVFAAGAARNVLLLAGVDQGSLQIDDDTVCDLRAAPDARPGLRARSFDDPTEMWFDERDERKASIGIAAAHEQLLGRRASASLLSAMEQGDADLRAASAGLLTRASRGGVVRCTQLGVRGDSALGTMVHLLTTASPTRDRLVATEAIYRRAITSRRLTRAVSAATITELDTCMTFAIGLDARSLLPPFPPVERNEDGLFGSILSACDPSALFGHLPVTVAHEPEDPRQTAFEIVFDQAGRIGVNDMIAGLASASLHEIDHRSPAAAHESLARALLGWIDLPEDELFERLAWMLARRLSQRLARITSLLRESRREPSFWARDLDRLADVLRERIEDPTRAVPHDLTARHALPEARALAVRRVREYAEILSWWPAIWEAARALRSRGDELGEVLS